MTDKEEEGRELSPREQKEEAKRLKKEEKRCKKREKILKNRKLLVPANKKGKHIMHLMNFFRFLFCPIHFLVYPYKLYGHKKVGTGPCIYMGNHYCLWDVFYPARTTNEGIHFLMKESLLYVPVLGYWAGKIGAIPAMRDGSDVRTLMDSMKVLKNGEKISLFPEGTRNRVSDEEFLPFHGGAALMAIKTQTPVIPFVICNRPKVFHVTHVVFGEPMELSEYYGKRMSAEDYAAADEILKNRLYELRAEHRAYLAAKKKKGKKEG